MLVKNVNSRFKINQNFGNDNQQNSVINKLNSQPIKELSFTGNNASIPKELRPILRVVKIFYFDEIKNLKFKKDMLDGIKGLRFKESNNSYVGNGKTYILSIVENANVFLVNSISKYATKIKEGRNKIIENFDSNNVKGFLTQLLNYKDKHPFKISYTGHSFNFKKDSIILGDSENSQAGLFELSENSKLKKFLADINNLPATIIHNGKEHSLKPIFDNSNSLIGISAEPMKINI